MKEFCITIEREINRQLSIQMKTTVSNRASRGGLEIIYDEAKEKLTLKIGHLEEGNWSMHMNSLEVIEQYFISCEKLNLVLQCQMLDDDSTLFLMHILKMAERYQWLGEKVINVDCNLGLDKSNRYWLKEKLRKCFELDIRFSGFLTGGAML